jgi:type VI secretion system protein ImpD
MMEDAGLLPETDDAPDVEARVEISVRDKLVDAVLDKGGSDLAAALSHLMDADASVSLLSTWFGAHGEELLRDDPQRLRRMIDRDIATIDKLIGEQVDAILHHDDFKRLEAGWRGVDYLLDEVEGDEKVKVKLFNATWPELARDFDKAVEFDQSTLFAKVYSDEYGMPGGIPYGLLLCDYTVRHRYPSGATQTVDDIGALTGLAQVAAASFAPCVISAAPELFGVSTFADLSHMQKLDAGFQLAEYQRWRRLQQQEESRFLGVLLPRVLLRDRHGDSHSRVDGFRYREGGAGIDTWLWGNAVYAFGAVAIRSFRQWGWFADMRGARPDRDEAGVITGLPSPNFSTNEDVGFRRPLEVELTDRKQKALEELGFVAVSPCAYTRSAVFLGMQSLHYQAEAVGAVEASNTRLSSMLQYVLCVSRFAHYVKVMARDRVGAFTTATELETYLNDWLRSYMLGNSDAGAELKARYPLGGGAIQVKELPGKPGVMSCTMHFQPHFQFDHLVTGLRLRSEIQAARAR